MAKTRSTAERHGYVHDSVAFRKNTGAPYAFYTEAIDWNNINNIPADFADNTDNVDDADAKATNEIQDLSRAGNTLSLTSDATTVDLAPYLDNTDTLAGLPCSTNQIAQFNGANWVCATAASDSNSAIMETSDPFMFATAYCVAGRNTQCNLQYGVSPLESGRQNIFLVAAQKGLGFKREDRLE